MDVRVRLSDRPLLLNLSAVRVPLHCDVVRFRWFLPFSLPVILLADMFRLDTFFSFLPLILFFELMIVV